jgi:hypothetical protein
MRGHVRCLDRLCWGQLVEVEPIYGLLEGSTQAVTGMVRYAVQSGICTPQVSGSVRVFGDPGLADVGSVEIGVLGVRSGQAGLLHMLCELDEELAPPGNEATYASAEQLSKKFVTEREDCSERAWDSPLAAIAAYQRAS